MFDHHTTLKVEILRLSKNHSSELEEIVLPHETIYVASIQQTLVGYMSTYDNVAKRTGTRSIYSTAKHNCTHSLPIERAFSLCLFGNFTYFISI
jgi:hypothetical protein